MTETTYSRSGTSRRTFLQFVGLSAAPLLLTRRVSGQEAANDRFHVACIGVGGRGTEIGRQAGALANMVAVADVDLDAAESFAAPYEGRCRAYQDYRRILDRADVDAIVCGTPDHWHTRICLDAIKAGKDIYCEKPLTLTLGESRQITQATKASGRIFQVGTQQRTEFDQNFLKAIAIARSGRLGSPLVATSSVGPATAGGGFAVGPTPPNLNFDFWLGQAPCVDFCPERIGWNFRWWLEYSGGQVTDWGVHHTDIAMWALGGENSGAVEVSGTGSFPGLPHTINVLDFLNHRACLPHQYNVAETFECELTLANGNRILLNSGPNELLIEGPEGRIRVNRGGLTGSPVEAIMQDQEEQEWLDEQVRSLYRNMPIDTHVGNFIHCLKTREMPISDVWSHCHSVNACHMSNIAMLTKRKLKFDPVKYRFDDPVANQFISRAQRSPWQT